MAPGGLPFVSIDVFDRSVVHPDLGGGGVSGRRGSPTLRRRQLGMELRRLRERAGVTIDHVAARLECSASKISRIETGQTGVTPRDVRDILAVYGVEQEVVDTLVEIARQAREKGWWQHYGDVLTSAYVGLEAAADRIKAYEAQVIPGLLQTADYASAMLRTARPGIAEGDIDRRVRVRRSRQSLLTQDEPIDFSVVLDEAVLRRPVGGIGVMRRQFDHLMEMAARPNVTLRVLPFSAGAHAGMDGTFAMLLYEGPTCQNIVYAANAAGGVLLEKDDEVQRFAIIFDQLQACSLAPDDSIAMIASLADKEPSMRDDQNCAANLAGATWRKSSRSGPYSDNCVEVAFVADTVGVRDSTDPEGPVLAFSSDRWQAFVREARFGGFDLP